MGKTPLFLFAGLLGGIAVASFWGGSSEVADLALGDSGNAVASRLEALERALRTETQRRMDLQTELTSLGAELQALQTGFSVQGHEDSDDRDIAADLADERTDEQTQRERFAARLGAGRRGGFLANGERQVQRLIDAGFAPDRADFINQRTSELRMEALQAQYDAAREGESFNPRNALTTNQTLRSELGDSDYERYLEAMGRPTSVGVRDVLSSSPAEQAGLQAGDQVIAYSGKRVFDMNELNRLTLDGVPGETVPVDVLRDGQQVQVYVPRGPIGITGGGRFIARP